MNEFDLNSEIVKIKLSSITVGERIRTQVSGLEDLTQSLKNHGLLQPIIVDEKMNLIAGHRRVLAAKELNWDKINAIIVKNKKIRDKVGIEIDENKERVNFTEPELEKGAQILRDLEKKSIWERLSQLWHRFRKWIANFSV